jgi:hypothetical protein
VTHKNSSHAWNEHARTNSFGGRNARAVINVLVEMRAHRREHIVTLHISEMQRP